MNTTSKLARGLVAGGVAFGLVVGGAAIANAAADPAPTPPQTQQLQRGFGPGGSGAAQGNAAQNGQRGPGAQQGARAMNGSGQGAQALADYLADQLDVSADDVRAALVTCDGTGPDGVPGRDLSDADHEARHAEVAATLAEALGVDEAKVKAALDGYQEYRQADRTAAMKERLADAVESGRITQEQADDLIADHVPGSGPQADHPRLGMGPRR